MVHKHFTRSTLTTKQPDELIDMCLSLQDNVEGSEKLIEKLTEEIQNLKKTFTDEIKELKDQFRLRFDKLEADIVVSQNTTVLLERRCNQLDQYSRRESLEIRGIPKGVTHDELLPIIQPLMLLLQVDVSDERSIQAHHRLSKRNDDVIVKFTHREDRNRAFKNRCSLKDLDTEALKLPAGTEIFINENLTVVNKRLVGIANMLKRRRKLFSFWTMNGNLRIKIDELDNGFISIGHMNDFFHFFPNIDFSNIFTPQTA